MEWKVVSGWWLVVVVVVVGLDGRVCGKGPGCG